MALKRMVLQIGMGTDIRGADYTKAAVRALKPVMVLIEQMTAAIKEYDKQVEEMGKKHADGVNPSSETKS